MPVHEAKSPKGKGGQAVRSNIFIKVQHLSDKFIK